MTEAVTGNSRFTRFPISGGVIGSTNRQPLTPSHQETDIRNQCSYPYYLASYTTTTTTVTGCNLVTTGVSERRQRGDA